MRWMVLLPLFLTACEDTGNAAARTPGPAAAYEGAVGVSSALFQRGLKPAPHGLTAVDLSELR